MSNQAEDQHIDELRRAWKAAHLVPLWESPTGPMIWLDALDVPFHLYLGTAKFQPGPVNAALDTVADEAFAVANIAPECGPEFQTHSPVFRYRYDAASAAVSAAPVARDGSRR